MQVMTAQGPVIVEPKDKSSCPMEYDEDIVMMLGDYYHVCLSRKAFPCLSADTETQASDDTIIGGLLNDTEFEWLNEPQNLLVNGHALAECNSSTLLPGQQCGTSCGNNLQKVLPGKKYRVRFIGATILSYIGLALEGHNMTLIEVDVCLLLSPLVKLAERLKGHLCQTDAGTRCRSRCRTAILGHH